MTKEFVSQLRAYTEAAGFHSQRQLAQDAGIDHSTISRLLKGNRNATPNVAGALMHSLSVPGEARAEFLLLAAGHNTAFIKNTLGGEVSTPEQILFDGYATRTQTSARRRSSRPR